jgi:hypothetical protein
MLWRRITEDEFSEISKWMPRLIYGAREGMNGLHPRHVSPVMRYTKTDRYKGTFEIFLENGAGTMISYREMTQRQRDFFDSIRQGIAKELYKMRTKK